MSLLIDFLTTGSSLDRLEEEKRELFDPQQERNIKFNRAWQLELLDPEPVCIMEAIPLAVAIFWDPSFVPCPRHSQTGNKTGPEDENDCQQRGEGEKSKLHYNPRGE